MSDEKEEEEGGGSSGRVVAASQRRSVPARAAGKSARKAMIKDDDSDEEEDGGGRSGCECFVSFVVSFASFSLRPFGSIADLFSLRFFFLRLVFFDHQSREVRVELRGGDDLSLPASFISLSFPLSLSLFAFASRLSYRSFICFSLASSVLSLPFSHLPLLHTRFFNVYASYDYTILSSPSPVASREKEAEERDETGREEER